MRVSQDDPSGVPQTPNVNNRPSNPITFNDPITGAQVGTSADGRLVSNTSEPKNITATSTPVPVSLPTPSAVVPSTSPAQKLANAIKSIPVAQGLTNVSNALGSGSAFVQAKGGRVFDAPNAALETALNRLDPKPRAGDPPGTPRSQTAGPLAPTPAVAPSGLSKFGSDLSKLVNSPGGALADLRSKALGAGRNLYYPNKEAALVKTANELASKVNALETHYQEASKRLNTDIAQVNRSIAAAESFEARADALRPTNPAMAREFKSKALELAKIADRKVQYGFGELGTEQFSKALKQLEGKLTKLQARVVEGHTELSKVQSTSNDARAVMVARQRYEASVKKINEFLDSKTSAQIDSPLVAGAAASGNPGRLIGDRVSSASKLRESIADLQQLNETAKALPQPMSYSQYEASSRAAGRDPSVSNYLTTRADALRAVRGELESRFDATRQFGASEVRKIETQLSKAKLDSSAANTRNSPDVGQAGVEYSELKKLNKNELTAALNTVGIRKASERVDVMREVKTQAEHDGRTQLATDAANQLKVLERNLDAARRSTDVGAARKVMKSAEASVERTDAAAARATRTFEQETAQLTPKIAHLQSELMATQRAIESASPARASALRPHAELVERRLDDMRLRIADSAAGSMTAIKIAESSRNLHTAMQGRLNAAESLAGLTPSKVIFKPIGWAIKNTLKLGAVTTIGGLPFGLTKVIYNAPGALAPYNIAPASSTLFGSKGMGTVTFQGPIASITGFWQGPSLKGPTLAALIGQKGTPSPSVFASTTKEGVRGNFVFTSDSAQAAQVGVGMTVGTPNLNVQWLGQARLGTIGDTLRFVTTSDHKNAARYGAHPQLEVVTTGASGFRIPGTNFNLISAATFTTATKVNIGEIGITTIKESAPRRLFTVSGVPIGKATPHSTLLGKDVGTFGYLSKYTNIIEPNYALREAQRVAKENPGQVIADPFSFLQPPTKVLKTFTFDAALGTVGEKVVAPVTDGAAWVINGIRDKATNAMRGQLTAPTVPNTPPKPTIPPAQK
jgi:hypothetical protein